MEGGRGGGPGTPREGSGWRGSGRVMGVSVRRGPRVLAVYPPDLLFLVVEETRAKAVGCDALT